MPHDIREILNEVPLNLETGEPRDITIGEYLGMSAEEKVYAEERKRRLAARRERGTISRFVLLNPGVYAQLVRQLTVTEARVLAVLIDEIVPREGNEVYATTGRVADRLGILTTVVSKAVRGLIEHGALVRLRRGHYELNPWIAFSGSAEDWRWATDEWPLPKGTTL